MHQLIIFLLLLFSTLLNSIEKDVLSFDDGLEILVLIGFGLEETFEGDLLRVVRALRVGKLSESLKWL